MASPMSRTLELFRARGWEAHPVERRIHGHLLIDYAGFGDIIAFSDTEEAIIQACNGTDVQARVRKILGEPQGPDLKDAQRAERVRTAAIKWVRKPGRRIIVVGWRKYKARVDGKLVRAIETDVTLEDLLYGLDDGGADAE